MVKACTFVFNNNDKIIYKAVQETETACRIQFIENNDRPRHCVNQISSMNGRIVNNSITILEGDRKW